MTKSHGGITTNYFYQLNNSYTFTNQIRIRMDNIIEYKLNKI